MHAGMQAHQGGLPRNKDSEAKDALWKLGHVSKTFRVVFQTEWALHGLQAQVYMKPRSMLKGLIEYPG